jgi:hypothetical protein
LDAFVLKTMRTKRKAALRRPLSVPHETDLLRDRESLRIAFLTARQITDESEAAGEER